MNTPTHAFEQSKANAINYSVSNNNALTFVHYFPIDGNYYYSEQKEIEGMQLKAIVTGDNLSYPVYLPNGEMSECIETSNINAIPKNGIFRMWIRPSQNSRQFLIIDGIFYNLQGFENQHNINYILTKSRPCKKPTLRKSEYMFVYRNWK